MNQRVIEGNPIQLRVGQWIRVANGETGGPLFKQPNGSFTLGLQFIVWNEDGTTVPLSAKRGYTVVETFDSNPKPDQEAVKTAEEKRLPVALVSPICRVMTMQHSSGAPDHYVSIEVGDRQITPHMFKTKGRAEYEVAEWNWLLNGGEKPYILDFDTDPQDR